MALDQAGEALRVTIDMKEKSEIVVLHYQAVGSKRTEAALIESEGMAMLKSTDRWSSAYYEAINQLADVIATLPLDKVPPFQLAEVTDDLEAALDRRHRAHYGALCQAGFAYHCVQERVRRVERRRAGARMAAETRKRKVAGTK